MGEQFFTVRACRGKLHPAELDARSVDAARQQRRAKLLTRAVISAHKRIRFASEINGLAVLHHLLRHRKRVLPRHMLKDFSYPSCISSCGYARLRLWAGTRSSKSSPSASRKVFWNLRIIKTCSSADFSSNASTCFSTNSLIGHWLLPNTLSFMPELFRKYNPCHKINLPSLFFTVPGHIRFLRLQLPLQTRSP